jgi:hypothetical protein
VQACPIAACAALAEKYPDWKGKMLVDAINPHTPGYEAIDPKNPSKYVGLDIDLGEEIGECLGFNETGYAIKFLGFNAPDDGLDEWDIELEKTLSNQDTAYVEFDEDDEGCVWNIKVDWANYNESVFWKNVNLCKFNVLTALRLRDQDDVVPG